MPFRSYLTIVSLWTFAVAQPLYGIVGGNPEFLALQNLDPPAIWVFVVLLSLGLPGLLVLVLYSAGRAVPRLARPTLYAATAALTFLCALSIAKLVEVPVLFMAVLAFFVLVAALASASARFVFTSFLNFCLLGVFLPPVLFVSTDSVRQVSSSKPSREQGAVPLQSPAPTVLIVFDELPLFSLLSREDEIDAERFPNFAALSRTSTWFPRTAAVSDDTTKAVPAIFTGELPRSDALPVAADHPVNLFTAIGPAMEMRVIEAVSRLCPQQYCERQSAPSLRQYAGFSVDVAIVYLHHVLPRCVSHLLPSISLGWGNFARFGADGNGREDFSFLPPHYAFERFLGDLARPGARKPALNVLHVLLPHPPWSYLSSGVRYRTPDLGHIDGLMSDYRWGDDRDAAAEAYLRHFLQLQYADKLLGETLTRLRSAGQFDASLIVVTADHGASFRPGVNRRILDDSNAPELAIVPLFVKRPFQQAGEIDRRNVQSVDVAPTILGVLGGSFPSRVEGRDLFREAEFSRAEFFFYDRRFGNVSLPVDHADGARLVAIKENLVSDAAILGSCWDLGVPRDNPAPVFPALPSSCTVTVEDSALFERFSPDPSHFPAILRGSLRCDAMAGKAVALRAWMNGRLIGTRTLGLADAKSSFSFLLSPSVVKSGFNALDFGVRWGEQGEFVRALTTADGGYTLSIEEGAIHLHTPDGQMLSVLPSTVQGYVDRITQRRDYDVVLQGWAAGEGGKRAEVVVFQNGRPIHAGETTHPRPDVAAALGDENQLFSGFMLSVPLVPGETSLGSGALRVFALSGDRASELLLAR